MRIIAITLGFVAILIAAGALLFLFSPELLGTSIAYLTSPIGIAIAVCSIAIAFGILLPKK
jgi:hypothetical protein